MTGGKVDSLAGLLHEMQTNCFGDSDYERLRDVIADPATKYVITNKKSKRDRASAVLQHLDLFNNPNHPLGGLKWWLAEVCRDSKKGKLLNSPVLPVMKRAEKAVLDNGDTGIYLYVEQGPAMEILGRVYEGYGYVRVNEDSEFLYYGKLLPMP